MLLANIKQMIIDSTHKTGKLCTDPTGRIGFAVECLLVMEFSSTGAAGSLIAF
jgi:hypothetical protein